MLIRCPFCHHRIFFLFYEWHERKHTKLLPDGQMTDHVTLPAIVQFQGSLEGVPFAYRHSLCGAITGMPEEIIRSYLGDPFLYSGGSFCGGCSTYVPYDQLFWQETGECLSNYFHNLQEALVKKHDLDNTATRKHYIAVAMTQRKPGLSMSKEIVVLTAAAAKRIREIEAQMFDRAGPLYFRVIMRAPIATLGIGNFKLDISDGADRYHDQICESQGVKTVVLRDFAELLRGIRVDFDAAGNGFKIEPPFDAKT